MNLYIIGNGFDLNHDLETSFGSFKAFMEQQSKDTVDRWIKIVNIELADDWKNLEKSFEYVDYDYIDELCSSFIHSYKEEKWSDSFHHDYQYEISKYLDMILNSDTNLRAWLNSVYKKCKKKLRLEKNALYLTFNYTDTLEDVYCIEKNNICHIHGDMNSNDKLVLGHANPNILLEMEKLFYDDDIRIIEGKRLLNDSKQNSYKNSEGLIKENMNFFKKCKNVKNIYIIGHSADAIDTVDFKYYETLARLVNKENISVNVVIYQTNELVEYKTTLTNLGFKNINFLNYSDIEIKS